MDKLKACKKRYYEKHKEEIKLYFQRPEVRARQKKSQKKYRERPEVKKRYKKVKRKYYQENKERLKEQRKKYRGKNREKIRKYEKELNKNPLVNKKRKIRKHTEYHFRKKLINKFKKCVLCGSTENLEIHHEKYTENEGDLIVLCKKCHLKKHYLNNLAKCRENYLKKQVSELVM